MKLQHKTDWRRRRAREFPCDGGQLDAIWEFIAAQQAANPSAVIPEKTRYYLERVKAIRAKYPRNAEFPSDTPDFPSYLDGTAPGTKGSR